MIDYRFRLFYPKIAGNGALRKEIFNMEQKAITQEEKTKKEIRAEEQVKRARANLAKVRREKKEQIRQAENRHKYMMGSVVHTAVI